MSLTHWENCIYQIGIHQKYNLEKALNYLLQLKSLLNEKVENFQEPISFNPPELPIEFKLHNNSIELKASTSDCNKNDLPADYILIQCLISLGEVIGVLAHNCSKEKEWQNASELYLRSYNELNSALIRADYNIAMVVNDDQNKHNSSDISSLNFQHKEKLLNMCDALYIATGFSYNKMKEFQNISKKRKLYLEQQLVPLLTTRNEIKSKIGHERWINNPTPKNDYAEKRKPLELELKDIQLACNNLNDHQLEVSYHEIQKQSKQLLKTISNQNKNPSYTHSQLSSHNNSYSNSKQWPNTAIQEEQQQQLPYQAHHNGYSNYYHHDSPAIHPSSIHPISVGYSYFPYTTGINIPAMPSTMEELSLHHQQHFHSGYNNFHSMQSMIPNLPSQNYPRTYNKINARHGKLPNYSIHTNVDTYQTQASATKPTNYQQTQVNQASYEGKGTTHPIIATTTSSNNNSSSTTTSKKSCFLIDENYSGSSEKK